MSTITTRQSTVKPIVVEVAIRNAIARRMRDHGIAQYDTIADEVVLDLFGTRIVPTPDGVPTGFIYQGTHLNWPQGVDTRAVTAEEAATYTRLFALKWDDGLLEGESVQPPVVTTENNAAHLRNAYEVLWARVKHGKAQVESPVVIKGVPVTAPVAEALVKVAKARKARKKVEPVVPTEVVVSALDQAITELDALMADL